MLLVRYERKAAAAYVPHLDVLRAFTRIIRRAGLPIRYSEGYNPHMRLYFASPVPVGMKSECEYCVAESDCGADEFTARFNAVSMPGIRALAAIPVSADPNVAFIGDACEYEMTLAGAEKFKTDILSIVGKPVIITYTAKGRDVTEDVTDRIINLKMTGDTVTAILSAGLKNLRADRFAAHIIKTVTGECAVDILRKNLYNNGRDGLTLIDEYVKSRFPG